MAAQLTVIIPARQEEWLARTVADVLEHSNADMTRILVVLDGAWAEPPLDQHPRVDVLYHPESVGQRAACNEGARVATTPYIMKLDAHCSMRPGFDMELLAAAKVLPRETIQVPAQKNLHVFDWVCTACQWRGYMGPVLPECPHCKAKDTLTREIVWKPRPGTTTTAWFFDADLHFHYYDNGRQKPEQQGDYPPVMSLLGACWFLDRLWFLEELDGLDEAHGSWGQMGTELACKAWLSGGGVVCNKKTGFAHLFRTRGGFGFPYEISGKDQEAARVYSRKLWRSNGWPKQTRTLRSLVEQFQPPDWMTKDIEALPKGLPSRAQAALVGHDASDDALSVPGVVPTMPLVAADATPATTTGQVHQRQLVADGTVRLAGVHGGAGIAPHVVGVGGDQLQVGGIAAPPVGTDKMVDLRNAAMSPARQRRDQPRIGEPVRHDRAVQVAELAISVDSRRGPVPATSGPIDLDLRKESSDSGQRLTLDVEQPLSHVGSLAKPSTAGVIYYSDSLPDQRILSTCRAQLRRAAGERQIVAVTLPRWDATGAGTVANDPSFEGMEHVVMPAVRGYLTMARQILAALRQSTADVVFFCEHDCLYPAGYFDFVPPLNAYTYAGHTWKVDAVTGRALHYKMQQLSGLCGHRELLLDHFGRRVAHIEAHGFSRRLGFEPGKPVKHGGLDDVPRADRWNEVPIVDVRHSACLTPSRWEKSAFRNQRYTEGWTEGIGVPGWDMTVGRFDAFLHDVAAGRIPK